MSGKAIDLIHMLFEPNESLVLSGPSPDNGEAVTRQSLIRCVTNNTHQRQWMSLNPTPGPWPTNHNIIDYRNILIEFDKGSEKTQYNIIKNRAIPFTGIVHSGKKSLHTLLSLEPGIVNNLDEYNKLVEMIYSAVDSNWDNISPRSGIDRKCRNPARFTRIPGVIRYETGLIQEVKELGIIVTERHLSEFFDHNEKRISRYFNRKSEINIRNRARKAYRELLRKGDPNTPEKEPLSYTASNLIYHGEYQGSRHDALLKLGVELLHKEYDIDEIEIVLRDVAQDLGIEDRGDVDGLLKWLLTI